MTLHREAGATSESQARLAAHMTHSVATASRYYDKSEMIHRKRSLQVSDEMREMRRQAASDEEAAYLRVSDTNARSKRVRRIRKGDCTVSDSSVADQSDSSSSRPICNPSLAQKPPQSPELLASGGLERASPAAVEAAETGQTSPGLSGSGDELERASPAVVVSAVTGHTSPGRSCSVDIERVSPASAATGQISDKVSGLNPVEERSLLHEVFDPKYRASFKHQKPGPE